VQVLVLDMKMENSSKCLKLWHQHTILITDLLWENPDNFRQI